MKNETQSVSQYEIQSLKRALEVLDQFLAGEHRQMVLADLEKQSPLPKSTLFRILTTLTSAGYLRRDEGTESYELGPKLVSFASGATQILELKWDSVPPVDELVRITGETSYVGVLDRGDVVTVYVRDGSHAVRMHSSVGKRREAHASAMGKVLLAARSEEFVQYYCDMYGLKTYTKNTVASPQRLSDELARVRQAGWALDNEEVEIGLRCVAAPVLNSRGHAVAAVCLSGPTTRLTDDRLEELAAQVKSAAARISRSLGYEVPKR